MAREGHQVWNHTNYSQCDGVSIGSETAQRVCVEYATRRKQFKKMWLNWRVSNIAMVGPITNGALGHVQDHIGVQEPSGRYCLDRSVFNPDLLAV